MIYGLIFVEHIKFSAEDQRTGIEQFAKTHKLNIDEFISFSKSPNILMFNPGDTIICYAWNCLCKDISFLRIFMQHILKKQIKVYSVTSQYKVDDYEPSEILKYAFNVYEDMRFNFWSKKSLIGATKRTIPGRHFGSKNKKHKLDGKEKAVWDMYNQGASIYMIAKEMKVSRSTIRIFLTQQN